MSTTSNPANELPRAVSNSGSPAEKELNRDEQWELEEQAQAAKQKKKIVKTLAILAFIGVGMFGFAFANAPLFNMLCAAVGIELNPNAAYVATDETDRETDVYFQGVVAAGIPISVTPIERRQTSNLGKTTMNDYKFVNLSDRTIYFMPVHTIQPSTAADHFQLTACFCFDMQKIEPKQTLTLPVVYIVGSDLPENIYNMTLNYTMFENTKEQYEQYWSNPDRDNKDSASIKALTDQLEVEGYSLEEMQNKTTE